MAEDVHHLLAGLHLEAEERPGHEDDGVTEVAGLGVCQSRGLQPRDGGEEEGEVGG